MQVFRDILVLPTQDLLNGMGRVRTRPLGGIFQGGPDWPRFPIQLGARHCRGPLPWPVDVRPRPEPLRRTAPVGIWCGPASPHFGHMIADFGMRIAGACEAAGLIPARQPAPSEHRGWPLVFSVGPEGWTEPEPFFWQILAHFGVPREAVLLVREPTRFDALAVPPQAERLGGLGPSARHLDRMDAVAARHGSLGAPIACLFASRARLPDGRLAAEPYLAEALGKAGATVIHPETLPLADQLAVYRRARRIVFSEGSAVHALQLLGRLEAEVVVLVRRPGRRIAAAALRPRIGTLRYRNCARGQLHGLNARGRPQWDRALALLDTPSIARLFGELGIDLAGIWDEAEYRAALADDVRSWIAYNRRLGLHPGTRAALREQLAAKRIAVDLDEVWPAGSGTA